MNESRAPGADWSGRASEVESVVGHVGLLAELEPGLRLPRALQTIVNLGKIKPINQSINQSK